jgi:hypothetical protein
MSSYQVADHVVDHPPLFACRKHKAFLKLNRSFIDELIAWAPDIQPQPLTDAAAPALDGDDLAFKLTDYLIPPRITVFNPRKIVGAGSLPFTLIFIDKRFFGIPSSYLRRRIFEGCDECNLENDVASDASMPDYRQKPKTAPVRAPTKAIPAPAPAGTKAVTKPVVKPTTGATPKPMPRPTPAAGAAPAVKPTRSIPARPADPTFNPPRDPGLT